MFQQLAEPHSGTIRRFIWGTDEEGSFGEGTWLFKDYKNNCVLKTFQLRKKHIIGNLVGYVSG